MIISFHPPCYYAFATDDGTLAVANQNQIASREEVEEMALACKSHLANFTQEEIDAANEQNRLRREMEAEASRQRRKPKPRKVCFVYLMRNTRNGLTKIGYSSNPKSREATLQSEEPEIRLIAAFKVAREHEELVHNAYPQKRVRGEWFKLTEEDEEEIKDYLSTMEAMQ